MVHLSDRLAGGGYLLMNRILCIAALLIFLCATIFPFSAQAQALTFQVYPSPAPNRHGSGVSLTAYETWVSRALDSVENNRGNVGNAGSDPAAFIILRNVKPREYIVTSNPSWRAKADPVGAFANQQGNRLHFVLHVRGNGTVRFKFEDISWDWWSNGGWFTAKRSMASSRPSGYSAAFNRVDCTYGFGYDWGADRVKGGNDDVQVCNSDTTLVDELFYVGAGLGMAADNRYNRPDDYPSVAHLTVQDFLYSFCAYFNSETDTQQVGMLFRIVGSDGVTYEHTAQLNNPEFGVALQTGNCRPFPRTKSQPSPLAPTAKPPVYTGEHLQAEGYRLTAQHGLRSGVQFQRVGAAGVGLQSVIDAGLLDAVDVWGYAEQVVEVCFPPERGSGALLFLDANTTPRVVSQLASVLRDGYTCGTISGPGIIALVRNVPSDVQPLAPTAFPQINLNNCMVQTTDLLHFRESPGGNILSEPIPYNVTLTALARTEDWFKVDYHGSLGWISAGYVTPIGACG